MHLDLIILIFFYYRDTLLFIWPCSSKTKIFSIYWFRFTVSKWRQKFFDLPFLLVFVSQSLHHFIVVKSVRAVKSRYPCPRSHTFCLVFPFGRAFSWVYYTVTVEAPPINQTKITFSLFMANGPPSIRHAIFDERWLSDNVEIELICFYFAFSRMSYCWRKRKSGFAFVLKFILCYIFSNNWYSHYHPNFYLGSVSTFTRCKP